MRVSTQMMQREAVASMLDRQSDLSKTQLQVATGQRILSPSDDPSGTTQVLALNQQIARNEQYNSNISRLTSKLEAEEVALDALDDTLIRLRELAEQSLNETYGAEERAGIAVEVRQLLDEVFTLANSKDGAGEYIFSGAQSQTQAFVDNGGGNYVYQGDQAVRRIQISPTREIQSSDPGNEVFENLEIVAGGKQNLFKTIYDFATDLEANITSNDIATDLDTALSGILTTRARIGARINAVESQSLTNEQIDVQVRSTLSDIQDLDYAEAIGRMNLELAGLEAAQLSFQRIQSLSLFNFL